MEVDVGRGGKDEEDEGTLVDIARAGQTHKNYEQRAHPLSFRGVILL